MFLSHTGERVLLVGEKSWQVHSKSLHFNTEHSMKSRMKFWNGGRQHVRAGFMNC